MKDQNILKKELIGKFVEVLDSTNKSNIGIKGTITDETKYTIKINNKTLFKKNIILKLKNLKIKGEKLLGRPEDRIKVKIK